MLGMVPADPLDCHIKVEQQSALAVIAHHALNPEKRGDALSARHRPDMMQAGGGVQYKVPRRQLDVMQSESVFDYQFPTVIFVRRAEEQGRRKVGADTVLRARHLTNGVVHVSAERLASLIPIEQRREHFEWQRRRNE